MRATAPASSGRAGLTAMTSSSMRQASPKCGADGKEIRESKALGQAGRASSICRATGRITEAHSCSDSCVFWSRTMPAALRPQTGRPRAGARMRGRAGPEIQGDAHNRGRMMTRRPENLLYSLLAFAQRGLHFLMTIDRAWGRLPKGGRWGWRWRLESNRWGATNHARTARDASSYAVWRGGDQGRPFNGWCRGQ